MGLGGRQGKRLYMDKSGEGGQGVRRVKIGLGRLRYWNLGTVPFDGYTNTPQ